MLDDVTGYQPAALDLDSLDRPIAIAGRQTGGASVARFGATGAVDTTYASAGVATLAPTGGFAPVDGVVGPGDVVVMVGSTGTRIALGRLTASGLPDATLDGDGVAIVTSTVEERPLAMKLRGGKAIVAGTSGTSAAILRINGDGTLDTTFDTDGRAVLATAGSRFGDLTIDALGRIIAVGSIDGTPARGLVARFTTTGRLDATFGTGGVVTLTAPGAVHTLPLSIAEATNGDFLLAGLTHEPSGRKRGLLVRLTAAGGLVPAFGTAGFRAIGLATDGLEDVELRKLRYTPTAMTVFGSRREPDATSDHVLVVRIDENGAPVPGFATGGSDWLVGGAEIRGFRRRARDAARHLAARGGSPSQALVLMKTAVAP